MSDVDHMVRISSSDLWARREPPAGAPPAALAGTLAVAVAPPAAGAVAGAFVVALFVVDAVAGLLPKRLAPGAGAALLDAVGPALDAKRPPAGAVVLGVELFPLVAALPNKPLVVLAVVVGCAVLNNPPPSAGAPDVVAGVAGFENIPVMLGAEVPVVEPLLVVCAVLVAGPPSKPPPIEPAVVVAGCEAVVDAAAGKKLLPGAVAVVGWALEEDVFDAPAAGAVADVLPAFDVEEAGVGLLPPAEAVGVPRVKFKPPEVLCWLPNRPPEAVEDVAFVLFPNRPPPPVLEPVCCCCWLLNNPLDGVDELLLVLSPNRLLPPVLDPACCCWPPLKSPPVVPAVADALLEPVVF